MENGLGYLRTSILNGWATVVSLLHLLFIRATVPVLVITALLVLLLSVDQTKEILYDIFGRLVVAQFWVGTYEQLGLTTYTAIWFATALLAITVYLSLLRLAMNDGGKITPAWSPRLLAVANLAVLVVVSAVHFILLSRSRWLIDVSFFAIMVSVIATAIFFQSKNRLWVRGVTIFQLLIIVALIRAAYSEAFYFFWGLVSNWNLGTPPWVKVPITPLTPPSSSEVSFTPLTWPILISALTPQVTLLFSWWTRTAQLQRLQYQHVRNGLVTLTLITTFVLFIYPWTFESLPQIGGVAIVLVWLAGVTCVLSWLTLLVRALKLPALFVIIATAIPLYWLHQEGSGREILEEHVPSNGVASNSTSASPKKVPPDLRAAMAKLPGLAHSYVISADGGGLRAAFFTATVLAASDDFTCGEFGTRVRAVSGVSGGALGIATWMILREEYMRQENARGRLPWQSCWDSVKEFLQSGGNFDLQSEEQILFKLPVILGTFIGSTLLQDHLTMPLFATLTKDLLSLPATKAMRGKYLAESWQNAAQAFLRKYYETEPDGPEPKAFAIPLLEVTGGIKPTPLLVFSSTNVKTGELVTFSNVCLETNADNLKTMSVAIAALNSARFPIISPPGLVQIKKESHLVVDGGFFDNTGATALYSMLKLSGNQIPADAEYLRINGNVPIDKDNKCGRFYSLPTTSMASAAASSMANSPLSERATSHGWSAIEAFIAVRSAHDKRALDRVSGKDSDHVREAAASPLQIDTMPLFDDECPNTTSIPIFDHPLSAAEMQALPKATREKIFFCNINSALCIAQNEAKQLPLAWYLSQGSGFTLERQANLAAIRLMYSIKNINDLKSLAGDDDKARGRAPDHSN